VAVGLLAALTALASVWVFRPPTPSRRPFTIHAPKPELRLRAGDEATVAIIAAVEGPGAKANVVPVDVPGWLHVTPEGSGSASGLAEFRVAVDFDAPSGLSSLTFR